MAVSETKREESRKELLQTLKKGTSVAFRLDNTELLRSVIQSAAIAVNDLREGEVALDWSAEGLVFRSMDPSHVELVDISVPANVFYNYVYQSEDKMTRTGFRIKDLLEVAKIAKSIDRMDFSLKGEKAHIDLGGSHTKNLELIEAYHSDPPFPKIDYSARVVMSKYALSKVLRECAEAEEDRVTITVNGNANHQLRTVSFMGKSNNGESNVGLHIGQEGISDILCEEGSFHSTFSVDNLYAMVRAVVADLVSFEVNNQKPLRCEFPLSDVRDGARLVYWLAPRVGEETKPPAEPDEGLQPPPTTPEQEAPSTTNPEPEKPKKSRKRASK